MDLDKMPEAMKDDPLSDVDSETPEADFPKKLKADKMPEATKDDPLSDVDSETPEADFPKKLKADKMPEATKDDPLSDVDSETPEADFPKKLKADKMPEATKDDPLSDVDSETPEADFPKKLKADKMSDAPKDDPLSDVDSETPEADFPKKLKADKMPDAPKDDPLSDVDSETPEADFPKKLKANKMPDAPKDDPLSDVDSETPEADFPKKLKADKMPDAPKDDPLSDVDSETPEVEKYDQAAEDDRDGDLFWPGSKLVKMPADPNAAEIASKRPTPFNNLRPKENVVVELPKAFDPYKFVPYVYEHDGDEDDYFVDDNDRAAYELYRKEFVESDGFDVEHFYNDVYGALKPLRNIGDNNCIEGYDCEPTAVMAIKYYNMVRNQNLELEKLIKCNSVSGSRYYATFQAKDTVTGAIRTYQAKVARNHFSGRTTIHKFRPKPDSVPEAKTDA